MYKLLLVLVAVATLSACHPDDNKNGPGEVTCYSGGKEIYRAQNAGNIVYRSTTNGFYFEEQGTGQIVNIVGDNCVVRVIKKPAIAVPNTAQ